MGRGKYMESLFTALKIVLPLFIMLVVGYVIKLAGMMNETSVKQTNKVIFRIFLPILVFLNIYRSNLEDSFDSTLLLYAVIGVLLQFTLSLCTVIITEKDNERRGVMLQGMFRGNFVLFGIPVSTALFGDTAAGLASVLIAVVIPMYNALAVLALEMFNGTKPGILKVIKGILTNPLILASIAAILCLTFHITLPDIIIETGSDLAAIATPLAFVMLGASFGFGDAGRYVKDMAITLGAKLVFFPLLFLGAAILMGFRDAPLAVLLTLFGSPIAVSSFTMAQQMGGDDKLAGQLVVYSTLFSILTIFVFVFSLKELAFI